jgi:hypothetical protein
MAKSAVSQARARLGDEPLKWLFERCSEKWAHESARRQYVLAVPRRDVRSP